ncbi:MAG: hypothetical protein H5T95_13255 [Firmicutes bacterium]|nr:hypothetical protein [Bacillota bacterium]
MTVFCIGGNRDQCCRLLSEKASIDRDAKLAAASALVDLGIHPESTDRPPQAQSLCVEVLKALIDG